MTILRSLFQASTVTPTAAASVPTLAATRVLLADGTYVTGAQLFGQAQTEGELTAAVTATGATLANVPSSATSGAAITGVTATLTPSNATAYASLTIGGTEQTPRTAFTGTTLPSLTPGSTGSATIKLFAASSGGSALATSAAFTVAAPVAAPGQVTGLTVGTPASTSLPLTWTAPSTGGTPTGYSVTYTPSGGSATTVATGSTSTSYTLTGLTAATAYTITVAATNAGGTGAASASASGTTAASASRTYTMTKKAGSTPSSPASFGGNPYIGAGGDAYVFDVNDGAGNTPSSLFFVWTRSNTVPPTAGSGPNQYGTNTQEMENGGRSYQSAGYPTWWVLSSLLWAKGSPTTGSYYLWAVPTDSSGPPCVWATPLTVTA